MSWLRLSFWPFSRSNHRRNVTMGGTSFEEGLRLWLNNAGVGTVVRWRWKFGQPEDRASRRDSRDELSLVTRQVEQDGREDSGRRRPAGKQVWGPGTKFRSMTPIKWSCDNSGMM